MLPRLPAVLQVPLVSPVRVPEQGLVPVLVLVPVQAEAEGSLWVAPL